MKTMELFVDSKETDTEDGYWLFIDNEEEMAMAVKTALKNGYTDIKISNPKLQEVAECNINYKTEFELGD